MHADASMTSLEQSFHVARPQGFEYVGVVVAKPCCKDKPVLRHARQSCGSVAIVDSGCMTDVRTLCMSPDLLMASINPCKLERRSEGKVDLIQYRHGTNIPSHLLSRNVYCTLTWDGNACPDLQTHCNPSWI